MNTEHEYKVVEMMERYGGSFVQALAVCFHRADIHNFIKLRTTFSNYWDEYEKMLDGFKSKDESEVEG